VQKLIIFIWILLTPVLSISQELKCTVQVLSSQIQSSDKRVFQTLKNAIYEFMNNRKWTNDVFDDEERIDCSVLLNIANWDRASDFSGTIQIQMRRTIYNSSYDSKLLNLVDKHFHFNYLEYDPLEFSEGAYITNLTSILAFYAYIIIGLDYDSYSPLGGTQYIQKAQNIVNNAMGSEEIGWNSFGVKKNRYYLADNLLNQMYRPLRNCYYSYHRLGLDKMSEDVNASRAVITQGLLGLEEIHQRQQGSYLLQIFFDTKGDEIVNIYKQANDAEKTQIVRLLSKIDPGHTTKYVKIKK